MATILLIEDDSTLARMYKFKLEKEGFQVTHISNGEEGLSFATMNKVDLILLDMMLPKIPGNMLLQTLRQHPNGTNIPVIVLSNLTDHDQAEQAKKLGVKEYLAKAMHTPEEVVERVKQYVPASQPASGSESTVHTNPQK